MKLVYLFIFTFVFGSAQATDKSKYQSVSGKVIEMACVEVNPFVIEDACIVFVESAGGLFGLVFDDYDLGLKYGESNVEGHLIKAESCSYFSSHDDIVELKNFNDQYFYLKCDINFVQIAQDNGKDHDVFLVANKLRGQSYYSRGLPKNFSDKSLSSYPKFSEELKKYLAALEVESLKDWQTYVDAGNMDYLQDKKEHFRQNPKEFFQVPFLNVITEFHELYKDGVLIGYAISLDRYVRAQIIEDGSGMVIYTNRDLKIISVSHWDA